MTQTTKKHVSHKAAVYQVQRGREAVPGAFASLTPKQQKRLRKQIHKQDGSTRP